MSIISIMKRVLEDSDNESESCCLFECGRVMVAVRNATSFRGFIKLKLFMAKSEAWHFVTFSSSDNVNPGANS